MELPDINLDQVKTFFSEHGVCIKLRQAEETKLNLIQIKLNKSIR